METNTKNRKFWDRYAKLYDAEVLRFSGKAYEEVYRAIGGRLTKEMRVLEIATGTGLMAVNIAPRAAFVEATDFSPKMIETAKKKSAPGNVRFSVEDGANLSFADNTFDAVVISNALHIMPEPEVVLAGIRRVLKPGGLLFAPTFSHGHLRYSAWKLNAVILKMIGFETYSKWTPEEFVAMIGENGFAVTHWRVLKAAFPLVYLEATLAGGKTGEA